MEAIDLFRDRLGRNPYCSDDLATDGLYRLPVGAALAHRLIQPNTIKRMACLCYDVDRPEAANDWEVKGAPPPNLSIQNPANGHAHLVYLLTAPVPVSDLSRIKPVQYLSAIQEGLRRTLDADRGYAGLVVKNPLHPHWITQQWADGPYQLDDMASGIKLPSPAEVNRRSKDSDYAGLGRNCTLFEMARKESYSLVRQYWRPGGAPAFDDAVLNLVLALNVTAIGNPLPESECKAIARSVSRWVWRRFNPAEFRAIQAARGARKGAEKREKLLPTAQSMAGDGCSLREIAKALDLSKSTVDRWLKQ